MVKKTFEVSDILKKIDLLPIDDEVVKKINCILENYKVISNINCALINKDFVFNNSTLSLRKKSKMFLVFSAFCSAENLALDRKDLIEKIYFHNFLCPPSQRRIDSLNHNIVKLISRARRLATKTFTHSYSGNIDWFPYFRRIFIKFSKFCMS